MDWTVAFPFPLPEMFQVAILTGLDVAVSLALFAGCLLAERTLSVRRVAFATRLMVCLLGACETVFAFIGAASPGVHIVGPIRLLCISVVLIAAIWITRSSTRRVA
jgi:hypothetical protein